MPAFPVAPKQGANGCETAAFTVWLQGNFLTRSQPKAPSNQGHDSVYNRGIKGSHEHFEAKSVDQQGPEKPGEYKEFTERTLKLCT